MGTNTTKVRGCLPRFLLGTSFVLSAGCACTRGPQGTLSPNNGIIPAVKTVSLDEAVKMVHESIAKLQKEQNKTGFLLSQAQVQLTLTAMGSDSATATIGVTLPFTINGSATTGLQSTTGDQITLTFTNYLTLPTSSVVGELFSASTRAHTVTTETDVTNGTTVTKQTSADATTPDVESFSKFLEQMTAAPAGNVQAIK